EAAASVAILKKALSGIGRKTTQTTDADLERLRPYYMGEQPATPQIMQELATHRIGLQEWHLTRYKKNIRTTPEGKSGLKLLEQYKKEAKPLRKMADEAIRKLKDDLKREIEDESDENKKVKIRSDYDYKISEVDSSLRTSLLALDQKYFPTGKLGELVPLGTSYTEIGDREDLPELPIALLLALDEDPNLASRARASFMLALNGMNFGDTPAGKLCQVFAGLLAEKNRATQDAHDSTMRTRLDGASLALLTYGILVPEVIESDRGKGKTVEKVGFRINLTKLERHAEVFLIQQQTARMLKELGDKEIPESRREEIVAHLATLEKPVEDADRFIANLKKSLGIKEPRTIFESVGNRLYMNASELPVFDTPQIADTDPKALQKSKSLSVVLAGIKEREKIPEKGFYSPDLEKRAADFKHALNVATVTLREYSDNIESFGDSITDEDTRFIAINILYQLNAATRKLKDIKDDSEHTLEVEGKSEANMARRKELFAQIPQQAAELHDQYVTLRDSLMGIIAGGGGTEMVRLQERDTKFSETYGKLIQILEVLQKKPDPALIGKIVQLLKASRK
ncbi:hypothetical protein EBR66_01655, partial [bacterium]|nr:hypothetical protein [bacterium]